MSVNIIGAGMAGLLAANMLSARKPIVVERSSELPNNHHAVLRFRSDIVGKTLAIPFRKVNVIKHVHGSVNPVKDAVSYSRKVTGRAQVRSIIDTSPRVRYIAPPDLIQRMAAGVQVVYSTKVDNHQNLADRALRGEHTISTIPMPLLMDLLEYPKELRPEFSYRAGWTVVGRIAEPCDLFASIYYPYGAYFYRTSVTGDRFMAEAVGERPASMPVHSVGYALADMGFGGPDALSGLEIKESPYQKIDGLDWAGREKAKRFIMWASREYNCHSLGRFATWRPGLLLDDVVNDVHAITRLIDGASAYNGALS